MWCLYTRENVNIGGVYKKCKPAPSNGQRQSILASLFKKKKKKKKKMYIPSLGKYLVTFNRLYFYIIYIIQLCNLCAYMCFYLFYYYYCYHHSAILSYSIILSFFSLLDKRNKYNNNDNNNNSLAQNCFNIVFYHNEINKL